MTGVFRDGKGEEAMETQSHVTMELEPGDSPIRTLRLAEHESWERSGMGSPWASRSASCAEPELVLVDPAVMGSTLLGV